MLSLHLIGTIVGPHQALSAERLVDPLDQLATSVRGTFVSPNA